MKCVILSAEPVDLRVGIVGGVVIGFGGGMIWRVIKFISRSAQTRHRFLIVFVARASARAQAVRGVRSASFGRRGILHFFAWRVDEPIIRDLSGGERVARM